MSVTGAEVFDTPFQAAHVWLIALMADEAIDPDGQCSKAGDTQQMD